MKRDTSCAGHVAVTFAGTVLAVLLTACGGGSGGGEALVIEGTWVSDAQPSLRGHFVMTGTTSVKYYSGTLSGNLEFYNADASLLTSEPVTGTLSEENLGSNPYWDIEFATADGKLTFFSPSYDGHDSTSQMLGQFTNSKSTTEIAGRWHSNPAGAPPDCVIDKAFYEMGYDIQDLAWNGSRLVAVATPAGGSAGIYEIDTSGVSPTFALKSLTPTPENPAGIAWDGTDYWVASPSTATSYPESDQFELYAYTSSWDDALSGSPVAGTGIMGSTPHVIAFWDDFLWYAPFLNFGSYQIDRTTGTITSVPTLQLQRPNGFDSDGTSIWVASGPPGGVWGHLLKYNLSGTLLGGLYAPESTGGGGVACEGSDFLWVAIGQNLYRLDVR